ncbi:MAG TPA: hypothetical protein DIT64_22145 [Verrucomicrobiales bacterium]|nr:hypothetical protein [Verrucomicrobiales bacterium]HRJ10755.1 MlaD family protein [Prosthecobacter sp.]HRK13172.1 MlaD family protein [Prosthecobacter sp.]
MSRKASPTLIGVFTLLALLFAAGAIMLLGAGKFMQRTHRILMHFEKSAMGLLVGSDVRFGGVRIGRVADISVLVDHKNNRKVIPVIVELEEKDLRSIRSTSGNALDFTTPEGVVKAVKDGLRAGMVQQSLLTGMLYIEFDIVPDEPGFVYEDEDGHELPTVPTIPTEIDQLVAGVADGLKKFNALDIDGVVKDLQKLLRDADEQIVALNMREISENFVAVSKDVRAFTGNAKITSAFEKLDSALAELRELSAKLNKGMDPVLADAAKVLEKAQAGMDSLGKAAADISQASNPRGPVLMRLQMVLDETERASRAIKELANDLKRNPNAILVGKEQQEPQR